MIARRSFLALPALLLASRVRAELRPRYGARLVGSLPSAPVALDPAGASTLTATTLAGLLFDTLYRLDAAGVAQPHLAETLPLVEGPLARIPIRRGVRFHDGAELTAGDVVASLERASHLAGAWALAGVRRMTSEPDAIRLELAAPRPDLPALLATPALAITRAGKPPSPRNPVGTGAFRLDRRSDRRIELVGHDEHFAGRPFAARLILRWFERLDDEARAYEAGEADVSLAGAVAFAGHQPKNPTTSVDGPASRLGFVGFGKSLAGDAAFQRALSLALNRAAFKHLGNGERVVPVVAAEGTPRELETRARLADARAALGRSAVYPPLEVIFDESRLDDREVAARVVSALDGLGLRASFTPLPPAELVRREGSCQLYLGELVTSPVAGHAVAQLAGRLPLYRRAPRAHFAKNLLGVGFDALGRLTWADVSRAGGEA